MFTSVVAAHIDLSEYLLATVGIRVTLNIRSHHLVCPPTHGSVIPGP